MYYICLVLVIVLATAVAFGPQVARGRVSKRGLQMSSLAPPDLNLAALPTMEEWMSVCDPELRKVTTAMFRAVKEISYKVSCERAFPQISLWGMFGLLCLSDIGPRAVAALIFIFLTTFAPLSTSRSNYHLLTDPDCFL